MKTLEILLIGFFILLMLFGVILVRYSNSEGSLCTQNPLTYYENKNTELCSCFCSGKLYAGQNYINNFKQQYTNEDNLDLNLFNETPRNLS